MLKATLGIFAAVLLALGAAGTVRAQLPPVPTAVPTVVPVPTVKPPPLPVPVPTVPPVPPVPNPPSVPSVPAPSVPTPGGGGGSGGSWGRVRRRLGRWLRAGRLRGWRLGRRIRWRFRRFGLVERRRWRIFRRVGRGGSGSGRSATRATDARAGGRTARRSAARGTRRAREERRHHAAQRRDRRLRRLVLAVPACVQRLSTLERRVLVLRAGVGAGRAALAPHRGEAARPERPARHARRARGRWAACGRCAARTAAPRPWPRRPRSRAPRSRPAWSRPPDWPRAVVAVVAAARVAASPAAGEAPTRVAAADSRASAATSRPRRRPADACPEQRRGVDPDPAGRARRAVGRLSRGRRRAVAEGAPPLVCGAVTEPREPPHHTEVHHVADPARDARRELPGRPGRGRARPAALLGRPRHERDAEVDPGRATRPRSSA